MSLEHIKETENIIDVFENDIELYTKIWCEKQGMNTSDIISISQNRFSALLSFLYKNIFKDVNLKSSDIYNQSIMANTSCNAYNIPLIESICDEYIRLCDYYDKIINVEGFSKMVGIPKETIYEWSRDESRKASARTSDVAKRLISERERTLSDRLASGTKNPVGVLGCLNHWHNWAGVGNMEERKPQQVRLSDVQKSVALLSDNSPADGRQIEQKQPVKLSDNSTQ